jgi:hypothetical protein
MIVMIRPEVKVKQNLKKEDKKSSPDASNGNFEAKGSLFAGLSLWDGFYYHPHVR